MGLINLREKFKATNERIVTMHLLQPLFIVLLYVAFRSADMATQYAIAKETIRAFCYGLVMILALIAMILMVL